jgi:hypothetical protein
MIHFAPAIAAKRAFKGADQGLAFGAQPRLTGLAGRFHF